MANIKSKYKIYNGTGWDVYHFETVASQVGTVAKGGTGYDESNQFVKGSQKDKLDLETNVAGAFATLDANARLPELNLPNPYSNNITLGTMNNAVNFLWNGAIKFGTNAGANSSQIEGIADASGGVSKIQITSDQLLWSGTPNENASLVNRQYVDRVAGYGLNIIEEVRTASTAKRDSLKGTGNVGDVIVEIGDRVLLKNQTNKEENGVWIVKTGDWARADDADTGAKLTGGMVAVESGTNRGRIYWQSEPVDIVDTSPQTWSIFTSVGQFYYADEETISLDGLSFGLKDGGVENKHIKARNVAQGYSGIELNKLSGIVPSQSENILPNFNERTVAKMFNELVSQFKNVIGETNWYASPAATIKKLNDAKQNKITVGATEPAKVNGDIWIDTN